LGPCLYFLDVPVYRLEREKYYSERTEFVDKTMYPDEDARKHYESHYDSKVRFQDHLETSFGGCWEYNEIIGYIRLHFLGSQIRGEYFAVNAKRIIRTRKKIFTYRTHKLAPEESISFLTSSAEIADAISRYIETCATELPNRYVDRSVFDAVARHVDWLGMAKEFWQNSGSNH
jgi:hypothetical protein